MDNMLRPPIGGLMNLQPNMQTGPGPQGPMLPMGQRTTVQSPPVVAIPIQAGDTLSAIAKRYGTTVSTLQYMNGIKNPDEIFAGKSISVPNPKYRAIPQVAQSMQGVLNPQMPDDAIDPVGPIESLLGGVPGKAAVAAGTGAALMSPKVMGALSKIAPAINKNAMGGPNLARVGHVAEPMARGAVAHPGATPAFSNVRPVGNNPAGVAQMIRPRATTIQPHPSRLSPEDYMSLDSRRGPFRGMYD